MDFSDLCENVSKLATLSNDFQLLGKPVAHEQAKILTSTKLHIEYETLSYVIPIQA